MKLTLTKYVANSSTETKNTAAAIAAGIATLLTKVAQAGAINWSTATWSSVTDNTVVGWEMYAFNDSLQATYPLYVKLEYGTGETGGYGGKAVSIWMTVGKGTSGAGVVTNIIIPRRLVFSQQVNNIDDAANTNQSQIYLSNMDGSALTANIFPAAGLIVDANSRYPGGYFALERSRDAGGNATGDGVFLQFAYKHYGSGMGVVECNAVNYSNGTLNTLSAGIAGISFNLDSNVSIAMGSTVPVFSGLAVPGDGIYWAPRAVLGTSLANYGGGQAISALLESRDYLSAGGGGGYSDLGKQRYATAVVGWY